LKKDYLKKVRDFFSKNVIGGNTRDESSIRLQKQAHDKRESHELEEDDGAYVSKPGTNACMTSSHKSLHICFWIVTGGDLNTFQQNWRRRKNH
jgi:hypothetical protein